MESKPTRPRLYREAKKKNAPKPSRSDGYIPSDVLDLVASRVNKSGRPFNTGVNADILKMSQVFGVSN